jgi:hypothetical protein
VKERKIANSVERIYVLPAELGRLWVALATVPVLGAGLGADVERTMGFFELRLRAAAEVAVLDLRAAGLRAGPGATAACGIAKRSPASGVSDAMRLAAAITLGDAPYRLPIMASVSPLSTLCTRQEARRSGGTVSNAAVSETPVPRGTFKW